MRRFLRVSESERFDHGWDTGRGYDVPNGIIPGLRMIFLNSIFFAPGYDEACAPVPVEDPGGATMAWLADRLDAAERAGEKVWLLTHIPPGADAYATLASGGCRPGGLRTMWTAPETEWFVRLLARYRGTVQAVFAGHTHMDEFRLVGQGDPQRWFRSGHPRHQPDFRAESRFRRVRARFGRSPTRPRDMGSHQPRRDICHRRPDRGVASIGFPSFGTD